MPNEIISYIEMCSRGGTSLQRGMNYGLGGNHSVILKSLRPNAPYRDRVEDDGSTLIYDGHDEARSEDVLDPKSIDQPLTTFRGTPTQNGRFFEAAQYFKAEQRTPESVRVYEKLRQGIWSYNGLFHLVDAWKEFDGQRHVFKFRLAAIEDSDDYIENDQRISVRRRIIPTHVKLEVWKRDKGRCVQCGAADELHFDHVLPFSKGGTSMNAENVQLLCARHNLEKRDQIV